MPKEKKWYDLLGRSSFSGLFAPAPSHTHSGLLQQPSVKRSQSHGDLSKTDQYLNGQANASLFQKARPKVVATIDKLDILMENGDANLDLLDMPDGVAKNREIERRFAGITTEESRYPEHSAISTNAFVPDYNF